MAKVLTLFNTDNAVIDFICQWNSEYVETMMYIGGKWDFKSIVKCEKNIERLQEKLGDILSGKERLNFWDEGIDLSECQKIDDVYRELLYWYVSSNEDFSESLIHDELEYFDGKLHCDKGADFSAFWDSARKNLLKLM